MTEVLETRLLQMKEQELKKNESVEKWILHNLEQDFFQNLYYKLLKDLPKQQFDEHMKKLLEEHPSEKELLKRISFRYFLNNEIKSKVIGQTIT